MGLFFPDDFLVLRRVTTPVFLLSRGVEMNVIANGGSKLATVDTCGAENAIGENGVDFLARFDAVSVRNLIR